MTNSPEHSGFSVIKDREKYWHLSIEQQALVWAKIIALGLHISDTDAFYKISRNNTLPIKIELDGYPTYPRFTANANLLAQASPHHNGPRGLRASLASSANILRISGITRREVSSYGINMAETTGGIGEFLLEHGFTAANPKQAPSGVYFSDTDIRDGIYIPKQIDLQTARALGVIYANGSLGNGSYLTISSPIRERKFFEEVVRRAFAEAFNFPPDQNVRVVDSKSRLSKDVYKSLQITYASKALKTYLLRYIDFPNDREERRGKGLSQKIKSLPIELQNEFLKYFLAGSIAFDWDKGLTRVADVSEEILKDIEVLVKALVSKHSISLRPGSLANHSILSLSTIPSLELYILGYFDTNPRLKAQIEEFWNNRVRSRALGYLKRTYHV